MTGKGGTGRSVVSASLALAAARRGARVLAVSMGTGHGLARHLGADVLDHRPRPVDGIHAAKVVPAAALDEYLRLRLKSPRLAGLGRVFHVVAEAVPGVRDTVMIGKVIFEATRPRWDLVIADCPPTGQVLSYLSAPDTIEGLVPTGTVRAQASWMRDVLSDPERTGAVVVAIPEELPVTEALEFTAECEGHVDVAAVVANRVVEAPSFAPAELDREPAGPRRAAAVLHREVWSAQQAHLERLGATVGIPQVFGVRTYIELAERIADEWSAM